MESRFDEVIDTRDRLREIFSGPGEIARDKDIDHIDDICRRFIAASPFVAIASRGPDGRMDVSPKGDPAGFVAVLDEKTLAIPDRLGNNRLDTLENVLADPQIALIFVIPGHNDTLRVNGKARIVRDAALQERLAVNGKKPAVVLVVTVEEAFMHCSKCMIRSRMWRPEQWPDRSNVASLAEAMMAHAAPASTTPEVETLIEHDSRERLY